jgi:hypothetical protein
MPGTGLTPEVIMHRTLAAIVFCLVFVPFSYGEDYFLIPGTLPIPRPSHNVKDWGPLDYDDTPGTYPGGIVFGRVNGQRVLRVGGALFPMRVRVTEPGPDGPVTTRMVYPSSGQSSLVPLALQHQVVMPSPAPGACGVRVQIPDPIGLLYVDGRLSDSRGEARFVETPAGTVRLRAAFKSGEKLLIEEKEVVVRAGQVTDVAFDGSRATAVALPKTRP